MSEILTKIEQLKRDRNAIFLAHYYQDPDIQDVADFVGYRRRKNMANAPI